MEAQSVIDRNMMRLLRLLILFLFVAPATQAQQKPYYTQYILNNYILNPALTGIESYTDVKLSYRNQWTGIDGAPVTTYFSIHSPIGVARDDIRSTPTSLARGGENVRGKKYWEEYTAPDPHAGLGGIVINDKTGYINRFATYVSYAYHLPLGVKTTLSAGFQAGFSYLSLDRSKITFQDLDPSDPAVGVDNGEINKFMPEVGAGLWLYSKDYFAGLSVLNIIPGKARFVNDAKYGTYFVPHFFAAAGYRMFLNDDLTLLPSMEAQFVTPLPFQIHANVKLQYQDQVWVGTSYRITDELGGFAVMAGVNISQTFNISYAYDAAVNSRLRTFTKSTHELMLGFLLNNKYGDLCPRNVW